MRNELRRLKSTDVILPTDQGREIRLRCASRPDEALAVLLYRPRLAPPSRLQPPQWLPKDAIPPASLLAPM